MSYAGPNALQRAKLAIEVIEKRIQKIGLQGKTRFDIIGAGSVHFSSGEQTNYYNEVDGDYRIRSAGFFEKKEDADGKLSGYIRIRSKTQGIALSLGDRITAVQRRN